MKPGRVTGTIQIYVVLNTNASNNHIFKTAFTEALHYDTCKEGLEITREPSGQLFIPHHQNTG